VIDLYERKHDEAWARVDAVWRALERSHLLRIEPVDVESHALRGAASLVTGRSAISTKCAAHLERVDSPLSRVLAAQLRGAIAHAAGDLTAAASHLRTAMSAASAAGMKAHRAVAELRLEVVSGRDTTAALDWFRGQGVVDPWAFAAILSPGLSDGR
jgi:hypothetical protein